MQPRLPTSRKLSRPVSRWIDAICTMQLCQHCRSRNEPTLIHFIPPSHLHLPTEKKSKKVKEDDEEFEGDEGLSPQQVRRHPSIDMNVDIRDTTTATTKSCAPQPPSHSILHILVHCYRSRRSSTSFAKKQILPKSSSRWADSR